MYDFSVNAALLYNQRVTFSNDVLTPQLAITCIVSLQTLFENKALNKPKKDDKRLSVERIYQKKTQLEHILLRPDTYIGSVEPLTQVGEHNTTYPKSQTGKCFTWQL